MRRLLFALFATAVVAAPLLVVTSGAAPASGASSTSAPAFSATENISRQHLVGTTEDVVDSRTVNVAVSQTANLRGRQEIQVSWSGAHPSSGIVANPNSIDAQQEEYPVVILQCLSLIHI